MSVMTRKFAIALAAVATLAGAMSFAPSAQAANLDRSDRSFYLGSGAFDPSNDFRWRYGPSIAWYQGHGPDNCWREYYNRRGHRLAKWVQVPGCVFLHPYNYYYWGWGYY